MEGSMMRLCRWARVALFAVVAVSPLVQPASAFTLWYNGDSDLGAVLFTWHDTSDETQNAWLFDDFVVGSSGWTVDRVWTNVCFPDNGVLAAGAEWQIRSGMEQGGGGTVVASGLASSTLTPTGRVSYNPRFGAEYELAVTGLDVRLTPGTYWLSVAPMGDYYPGYHAGVFRTYGVNAVGTPPGNNGNAYYHRPVTGLNWYHAPYDGSIGIGGREGLDEIPEPESIVLFGAMGMLALGTRLRRRGQPRGDFNPPEAFPGS
jgi:hypothetical protein